jgi:hypothetical protein
VVILNLLSALCGEGVHLSETPNLASFDAAPRFRLYAFYPLLSLSLSSAVALNWFSAVYFSINSRTTASYPFEVTSYSSLVRLLRPSLDLQTGSSSDMSSPEPRTPNKARYVQEQEELGKRQSHWAVGCFSAWYQKALAIARQTRVAVQILL